MVCSFFGGGFGCRDTAEIAVLEPIALTIAGDQWNAQLQLKVSLAPEAVLGLYVVPEHRRRRLCQAVRSKFNL